MYVIYIYKYIYIYIHIYTYIHTYINTCKVVCFRLLQAWELLSDMSSSKFESTGIVLQDLVPKQARKAYSKDALVYSNVLAT